MFSVNFRGGIEVKQFVKIHLILEAKFRDEPLEDSITFLGALDVNDVVLVLVSHLFKNVSIIDFEHVFTCWSSICFS